MLGGPDFAGVLELGSFGGEALLNMVVVAVLDVAVLDADDVVRVLFGEDLAVLNGLNGGVVVVLVHFTVDGRLRLFMAGGGDCLVLDGGVHGLVNGGTVLSILGKKLSDGCLCFLHGDWLFYSDLKN